MTDNSLFTILDQVPDSRKAGGKRHRLQSILALAVCAMLCGARSLYAIAQWGRDYGPEITEWLNFRTTKGQVKTPCVATLHRIFKRLDVTAFEAALRQWSQRCLEEVPPLAAASVRCEAIAVDGKSLRGTWGHEVAGVHLVAAFSHRLGITLSQAAVDPKTNEAKAVLPLLKSLVLQGKVVTGDAMFCQREICQEIVSQAGDYLLVVKENQETLQRDIEVLLPASPPSRSDRRRRSTSVAVGSRSVG